MAEFPAQIRCHAVLKRVLCTLDWNGRPQDPIVVEMEMFVAGDSTGHVEVRIAEAEGPWVPTRWFPWEVFERLEQEDSSSPGCP